MRNAGIEVTAEDVAAYRRGPDVGATLTAGLAVLAAVLTQILPSPLGVIAPPNDTRAYLYAAGNTRNVPRGPRPNDVDFADPSNLPADINDAIVAVATGRWPNGASTFRSEAAARVNLRRGHLFRVELNKDLLARLGGAQLALSVDGADVGGPAPVGHATIYNTQPMSLGNFVARFRGLGWQYVGPL